jgi:integrase
MARRKRRRTWGTGSIFERNGRYWIRWRENGQRRSKSFSSRETAEEALATYVRRVERGEATLPIEARNVPTLGELAKPWLDRRKASHRSWGDDCSRWKCHLEPAFGKLQPSQVDAAGIRKLVEEMIAKGASPATCERVVRLLSSMFTDLCERGEATSNPAKGLPGATRRLLRSTHDPKTTPFVERMSDIGRIYRAFPEPVNLAYAIGAFAGLRLGEILGLRWSSVDLERRRIVVSEQLQDGQIVRPKDLDSRVVPIVDSLLPVLKAAKLASGGAELVVQPMRDDGRHLDPHTTGKAIRKALAELNKAGAALPSMTWYQATRHTFASQWVINGGSIEKLRELMGHSTVLVTERYAHLRGDLFTAADLGRVAVDLTAPAGKVVPLVRPDSGTLGPILGTEPEAASAAT